MASTVNDPRGLILYDMSTQMKTKTILRLMKNINPGKSFCKYLLPNRNEI
jgi:hypothetical protein